jgi:hypothetical protein
MTKRGGRGSWFRHSSIGAFVIDSTFGFRHSSFSRSASRRRGSIYVAVLAVSVIVITIGVGGIAVVRAQKRAMDAVGDAGEARLYALSGIELARKWIALTPTWRSDYAAMAAAGTFTNRPLGSGSFSITLVTTNGPLDQYPADPVLLTVTGIKGVALQKIAVTLNPTPTAYTCLSTAVTSGGTMDLKNSTLQASGQILASNAGVTANTATINADVESVTTITGGTYNGQMTPGATARTLPAAASVFDHYITSGTRIPSAAMVTAGWKISKVLLSPTSNPLGGGTNTRGIYVIDCLGNNISIDTSRIIGTLVLLNAGAGSNLTGSVKMFAAVTNYPCLMVQGNFALNQSSTLLSETTAGVNFNPPGSAYPYPSGTSNATTTDTYPSSLNSLVYISGNATSSGTLTTNNLVVGGTFSATGTLNLTYSSTYLANPPPGFGSFPMLPSTGSWTQGVN